MNVKEWNSRIQKLRYDLRMAEGFAGTLEGKTGNKETMLCVISRIDSAKETANSIMVEIVSGSCRQPRPQ